LQFLGVEGVQKQVKSLQEDVLSKPPNQQALLDGLDGLKSADFRNQKQEVDVHWILGKMDRLVPHRVSKLLKTQANHTVDIIANAGHAPFISHPNEFMQSLLKGHSNAG
jgi:pimeloyl-[acyl-carrier protein] methyl ester esterase